MQAMKISSDEEDDVDADDDDIMGGGPNRADKKFVKD